MKYYILVTVILLGSFFVGQKSLAVTKDIIINEIGAFPSDTPEWVEIWNRGSGAIDIKDWKFWESNTNHSLHVVSSSDSMVTPGEYAVICQNADVFLLDYPNFIGSVFDSSWVNLSNSGEEIGLKDEAGNFVEQFSYISTTKYSLERINSFVDDYNFSNWSENVNGNSVGVQNSNYLTVVSSVSTTANDNSTSSDINLSPPSSAMDAVLELSTSSYIFNWSFIKINEIISDPVSGNELVELYNTGSSSVDLSGGSICDFSDRACKTISGEIAGHDWLVADLLTDRYLNNDGDSVILKDIHNNIVDEINYNATNLLFTDKGQSLIRKIDGSDTNLNIDWAVTNKITLGYANYLVVPVVYDSNSVSSGGSGGSSHNSITTPSSTVAVIKQNKISTTTKSSNITPKDLVNISWKLDWPYGLDVDEVGVFNTKGTADPRGGNINFIWNFGDNSSGTGHLLGHAFVSSGIYYVSVMASSSAGTISKKEFKVHVGSNFSVANASVVINSWLVTSTEDQLEFIELKNNLIKLQDVSGWKIKNKNGKEYELPDNTTMAASGTLKFFKAVHHLSFDKSGDEIKLTSPNDQEIHKVVLMGEKNKIKTVKVASIKKVSKTISNWQTVRGTVTVEPKTFGLQYFYINDGQSGFQIYQYKKDFPDLKIGDDIVVGGETSEINGVKRIKIKNRYAITVLATNKTIEPVDLKLEDVGDEMLGSLVKVSGDITEIKSNLMYLDDGTTEIIIYFKKGAKIDKQELKEGDKVEVVGILNQGKDGWQVLPRTLSDLIVVGHADEILSGRLSLDQEKQNETTNKYLTTTAGGLTALLLGFVARARSAMLVAGAKKVISLASSIIKRG